MHLGPCLTLVVPTGMSEGDRQEWLTAAVLTVDGLPEHAIAYGARMARQKADHPSKIVPIIIGAKDDAMLSLNNALRRAQQAIVEYHRPKLPAPEPKVYEIMDPDEFQREMASLMAELRAKMRTDDAKQ